MRLPTAEEINPYDALDGRTACKNFLGKSLTEAEVLFRDNSLYYQEDLMWMGPVAFRFYLLAAIHYIQSDHATNDGDFINGIMGTLEFRLNYEAAELVPIARELALVCGYILQHYEIFDLPPEIYGDLRGRFQALQKKFEKMLNA